MLFYFIYKNYYPKNLKKKIITRKTRETRYFRFTAHFTLYLSVNNTKDRYLDRIVLNPCDKFRNSKALKRNFEGNSGDEWSRVCGESSASGFEHAPLIPFRFSPSVRGKKRGAHACTLPSRSPSSSSIFERLENAAPFWTLLDRGHRFVRYENPGKSGFPRTRASFSIRRMDRFTFDFRGRVPENRPGYFSGARKSGKGWKGETNGTQLPLLPILLAPGKNIYILSPGPGHCATRNSNSQHYFWYTVPFKSADIQHRSKVF